MVAAPIEFITEWIFNDSNFYQNNVGFIWFFFLLFWIVLVIFFWAFRTHKVNISKYIKRTNKQY
ncbi:hypothetical protein DESC_780141 [Desulfosarcina cetonica]|nr:hypothetical protein DESC_780141 [Desulfosarcina cetonica]